MNHIENIEIRNFKSIRHAEIKDCRRVNVFIGYSNVGKSNILEAIGLLSFIQKNDRVPLSQLIRIEQFSDLFLNGDKSESFLLEVNNKYVLEIQYENDDNLFGILYETGKEISMTNFGARFSLNMFNKSVLDGVDNFSGHFFELNDFKVKPYRFEKDSNFTISSNLQSLKIPYGNNLYQVIAYNNRLTNELNDLIKFKKQSIIYDQSKNELRLVLKQKGIVAFTVSFALVADTIRRLMFHKAAILSNKDSVLLFEEPEAHMFPPYISKLTSDIVNDENNNQFFLATHSPFVMNDLISNVEKDELSIYIVSYENETGETLIHRMSDEDVNEAYQFGYDFFMNINNFIPQKQHD